MDTLFLLTTQPFVSEQRRLDFERAEVKVHLKALLNRKCARVCLGLSDEKFVINGVNMRLLLDVSMLYSLSRH